MFGLKFNFIFLFLLLTFLKGPPLLSAPIPLPGFDPDTGDELFTPGSQSLNLEIVDVGGGVSSFGFYYDLAPSELIQIFGPDDQIPPPLPPELSIESAVIDFTAGKVLDFDESLASGSIVIESTFTPKAGNIGFWYQIPGLTIYSETSRNGGFDLMGSYTQPGKDGILLGSEIPGFDPLSYYLVDGIQPAGMVNPVPEPASLGLLLMGIAGLAAAGRNGRGGSRRSAPPARSTREPS